MSALATGPLPVRSRKLASGVSLKTEVWLAESLCVSRIQLMLVLTDLQNEAPCLGTDFNLTRVNRALCLMSAADALLNYTVRAQNQHSAEEAVCRQRLGLFCWPRLRYL